jgi:nitrate/nitrite-specific signal transduction histidine kinase
VSLRELRFLHYEAISFIILGVSMQQKWWRSLRVKIVAWSFIPTVIILSAVAWFTYYSYQQVLVDQAMKQDWAMVQSNAEKFNLAIGSLINPIVLPIILDIDVHKEDPIEVRAQNILDQAKYLNIFDGGIYFLDLQGKVFKTQPPQPEMIGQDWSGTPAIRFIKANPGRGAFTDLRSIGSSEQEIICLAQSMNDQQGEYVGAFYVCFTINPPAQNTFSTILTSLDLGPDVIIMDGNQHILYSSDPSQVGKDLSAETYIQEILQGESGSIRFQKGTEDRVISYNPVDSVVSDRNRWIIFRTQSLDEIMQPSLPNRQLLLALLALGVIVPTLVTAYGVRHITEPIQKLIQASEQVTEGQFKQRIEVNTGDEIETLADQFNLMSAKLDESYSSLEKKVADRTRELAILNSIISVASHSLDIQEILEDALNKTVEQMGFEAGAAFRFELPSAATHLMAHRSIQPAVAIDLMNRYASTSQTLPDSYPKGVTTLEIEDFQDEELKDRLAQLGFQMLMYVPLSTKGRELGFFLLGKPELSQSSPEELALLDSIGKHVGVAMENAHLYEQAEQTAIAGERNRLARELHDAVTQTLFSASLIADVLPTIWKRNPEEGMLNLEELRQLTRGALAEMRTMLLEMRPETLARADLKTLLTQLADAFVGRVRVPLDLHIHGDCELTHEVKLVFYRVAQEALNNIAKHSGARQVEMRLECLPGQMRLLIKDDGLGFDLNSIPPDHLGITIMRERAASIGAGYKIESQIGRGTTVELDWRKTRKERTDEHTSHNPGDAG